MSETKTYKRHAVLVDRMANTLGIDLEEMMMRGMLDGDTLAGAVLNCSGCSNPDGCERWLDVQTGIAAEPPDMCRNVNLFDYLKQDKPV